uniref:Uncharacterized protein n=1 Tax=Arcella intermedia TaxID=1963864 RepID=A0A6B2L3I9_9EUKA
MDSFPLEPLSHKESSLTPLHFFNNLTHPNRPPQDYEGPPLRSISSQVDFRNKFAVFTNQVFKGWKQWDNMCIMGSAVVASCLPLPQEYSSSPELAAKFYHDMAYKSSDIDVYFYGLTTMQFANKLVQFHDYLKKLFGNSLLVYKTLHTITFVTQYPTRHIQVVLGNWLSLEHLLSEPDIDCTCVAFDGKKLWASERGRLSYNFRAITPSDRNFQIRGSPDYEKRLVKYSRLGFYIIDPEFSWKKLSRKYVTIGIAKMHSSRNRCMVSGLRTLVCGLKDKDILAKDPVFQKSSWKDHGIPYGPKWRTRDIVQKIEKGSYEESSYGPVLVKSPYTLVQDYGNEIRTIKLFEETRKKYTPTWHNHIFWEDEKAEDKKEGGARIEWTRYYVFAKEGTLSIRKEEVEQDKDGYRPKYYTKETYFPNIKKLQEILSKHLRKGPVFGISSKDVPNLEFMYSAY